MKTGTGNFRKSSQERALVGPVPFEILHALVELFVGEVEEGAGFTELFLDGLVADTLSFDMGGQAFGEKMHLISKAFDEYAVMANSLTDFIEPTVNPFESPVVPV